MIEKLIGSRILVLFISLLTLTGGASAQSGPKVHAIPPAGKELSEADRDSLTSGADALAQEIAKLRVDWAGKPALLAYLPDVMIFEKAVRFPMEDHETVDPEMAKKALAEGMQRAQALRSGATPWTSTSGVRGYISAIDGSVQPYRLSIPEGYDSGKPYRLDVVFHGRNELLTELLFIAPTTAPAQDKFVLYLYGRYCNASKFAGEIDCLEAMDAVKRSYPIDENRILDIGFSMGGASSWQFATHYTDLFAAASPGAGFAESAQFLHLSPADLKATPWYEQVLWRLYDCTDYAVNLANLPTIAYAGEIDPQKQSSDIMAKMMSAEGLTLERIIGPKTKHAYEKGAKQELDRRLDAILATARNPVPDKLRFTTWTLRYNRMYWLTIDGLERHWTRARADAQIVRGMDGIAQGFSVKTQNVSALTLSFASDQRPIAPDREASVQIDGSQLTIAPIAAGAAWTAHLVKAGDQWKAADDAAVPAGLHKVHGLQGPIDDAFMSSFLIVRPTGKPMNPKTGDWESAECKHAIAEWRRQFRGEAQVKDDEQVTDADLAAGNVVLFGDPSSNKLLGRLADKLPIAWDATTIRLGDKSFPADHHVLLMIYPNPRSPGHYVVLNSGFTFREPDYTSNARQTPKLPDYAVVNIDVPDATRSPGGVATAGFFGENWQLFPDGGEAALSGPVDEPAPK